MNRRADPLLVAQSDAGRACGGAGGENEIRKHVVRTYTELHFFLKSDNNLGQHRYAVVEPILFVWAKLDQGVRIIVHTYAILDVTCVTLCSIRDYLASSVGHCAHPMSIPIFC
jgi:hypothetical protein